MRTDALRISPHDADPLSWFSSRYLPIAFGAVAMVLGAVLIAASWNHTWPAPQLLAYVYFGLAFALIGRYTGPQRATFGLRHAIGPLLLSWIGVGLSAVGYSAGTAPIELWWAPTSAACVLMGLVTRSSALMVGAYSLASTLICGSATSLGWNDGIDFWPPLSVAVIAGVVPLMGGIAAVTYSAYLVTRTLDARDAQTPPASGDPRATEHARSALRQGVISAVVDDVSPFLDRIARVGEVGEADRGRAAALADEVRTVLVARVESSWLDDLADEREFVVRDPQRRAEWMTAPQRSAVRGMLSAVLGSPVLEPGTLSIELRGQPDNTTAVALSVKLDLPEGRRVTMLAPYYLSLQTVADEVSWEAGEQLRMRFQLPAEPRPGYLPE